MDFNPLAPHGARHLYPGKPMISVRFQSTSSSRSQTAMLIHDDRQLHLFQSTSSSRSQTVAFHWYPVRELQFQSTSSSRSQTAYQFRRIKKNAYFNPLAPHGARHKIMQDSSDQKLFQSTSSSRSQTYYWITSIVSVGFQSTSSSRSQTRIPMVGVNYWLFQSTSSSRSQTHPNDKGASLLAISIH